MFANDKKQQKLADSNSGAMGGHELEKGLSPIAWQVASSLVKTLS
jgi:hypothetical protein